MRDEFGRSRYEQRHRKRRVNVISNSLIAIVLLLIIVVSYNIFFSGNEPASGDNEPNTEQNVAGNEEKSDEKSKSPSGGGNPVKKENEKNSREDDEKTGKQDETVVTEGGDRPNVIETIVNPNWEPVGTVQTGKHVTVYSGVDWDEMVKAISYAVGLSEDEFTIHFLGNNGPNKSAGTIYTKNKEKIYKVYIEWVDGKGWKPTKVERLSAIE